MKRQQYAEEQGLLGSLCPGQKKLEGKIFYLDSVKKRSTALLLEAVALLGGRVESFLHKDVSFVVTGCQEGLKEQKCTDTKAGAKGTSEEAQHPIMQRGSALSSDKRRPGTPRPTACGSRGKALLEKAIRNNERLQGSSVLANARSWGVKILYVDDVLLYLKQLTRESLSVTQKRPERTYTKQGSYVIKAVPLRSPFLKIEDLSRKYRPLHMQSMTFPTMSYLGRFSPFETPPPRFEKQAEQGENKTREKKKAESSIQDKSQTPLSCNPSPWRPRKKDLSYCECCHQPFTNLEEHLQSDQHRSFVLDPSNYGVVDQLVTEMFPGFNLNQAEQSEETLNRPPTPLPICELEPLTDAETEHAVQALQRQSSSFSIHISSPTRGPLSSVPASPSPEVQFPIPKPPAAPPVDIQHFTVNTDCQLSDNNTYALSPVMPVLDVEPQASDSANQHPDAQCLSPRPDTPPFDPYPLPPALSPQALYPSYNMDPHSDPPVLSPQWYPAEKAVEGHTCEMDIERSVSPSVPDPVSSPHFPSVALTNAEESKVSSQENFSGFSEIICSTSGLEYVAQFSRRSRSLPRHSTTALNPKKRCRSASPEHSRSKKRRITAEFGYSSCCTEQEDTSAKLKNDIMKSAGSLLFDKVSCQVIQSCLISEVSSMCTVDTLGSKQTFTTLSVPTVRNLSQASNQMNISDPGGTFIAEQLSWPLSSKAKICVSPLHFPKDKSQSVFSSQDSQRSLSHCTSVCIESALIPDLAALSSSSSDSDWDCGLLSRLGRTPAASLSPPEPSCELDQELLHTPCTWMHDTSYESRLHTVLQPTTSAASLCGEEMDSSSFSRTVVQIVEVQH
ncbi:uncharacterized protein dbf4b [Plectropomus leopardus]|uniref:uncharacterized protein dbf4b n=1 Tax=Plectropomus leopardus TaxID=160734 RepID=UPI001C4C1B56|nr:uncharacterized protein dbf4b [Plectropomus leopardus]XP_042363871.1 uncharacterized protein dbf4b [Plectropomus leopardus]